MQSAAEEKAAENAVAAELEAVAAALHFVRALLLDPVIITEFFDQWTPCNYNNHGF